jgi:hypothetical protein
MVDRCAPSKTFSQGSCFTYENLVSIAEEYNNNYNDKIRISGDKKQLLRELTNKMKKRFDCSDQLCWMSSKVVKQTKDNDILKNTFRPNGPKKQFEWLSTSDINKVMEQYEFKHKIFMFLGALPYDFEELPIYKMNEIDLQELKQDKISKIGAVINLDTHDMSGSHWVALYIDTLKHSIYFFDSFGKRPGKRISMFIKKILAHMHKSRQFDANQFISRYENTDDYDVRFNKIQHQFKNSECGVYSMNFIIRLLGGETFDEIVNNITNDDDMNACRKKYFKNT